MKLSALLSALVHDLNHPGYSNSFLKASHHPLVEKYGEQSTSEKMHVACFKQMVAEPAMNFLEPLGDKERLRVLDLVEKVVLATDMSGHMEFIQAGFPLESEQLLVFKLSLAMKTSDLSHCCRNFKIHNAFVDMLKAEFYLQGDAERSLGKTISFGMDRGEAYADVSMSQVQFLSLFISPLFAKWQRFETTPLMSQLEAVLERNIATWGMLAVKDEAAPQYADGKERPRARKDSLMTDSFRSRAINRRVLSMLGRMYSIIGDPSQQEKVLMVACKAADHVKTHRSSMEVIKELDMLNRVSFNRKRHRTVGQLFLTELVL